MVKADNKQEHRTKRTSVALSTVKSKKPRNVIGRGDAILDRAARVGLSGYLCCHLQEQWTLQVC